MGRPRKDGSQSACKTSFQLDAGSMEVIRLEQKKIADQVGFEPTLKQALIAILNLHRQRGAA